MSAAIASREWRSRGPASNQRRQTGVDPSTIDKHIGTHLIDPVTLRSDDFDAFFAKRQCLLLDQIAAVLGKPIQSNAVASPAVEDVADEEDDTDDL